MSAQTRLAVDGTVVLLAALFGFELGQRLVGNSEASARSAIASSAQENAAAGAANRKLLAENDSLTRALAAQSPAVETDPEQNRVPDTVRNLARLQQLKVDVRITAVQNGKIYPGFAQLFGLSDNEIARLNDAIQKAHADMKEPSAADVEVSKLPGRVVVAVPPSESGARLRQNLMDEFQATLGPDRFAALTAMSGTESVDSDFDAFGSAARQITIMRFDDGRGGPPRFQVTDSRRIATGGSLTSMTLFADPNMLPEKYRWLGTVVPSLSDLGQPTGPVNLSPPAQK